MSDVWAVMLVKDEEDVIEHTLRHLAAEVDQVLVADNLSTDGTTEILDRLRMERELGARLHVRRDEEPGYWQSRKTTALAQVALELGARWVVPVDADEVWYAPDGRRVADYLAGVAPDVQIVEAALYNHLPSALDPPASCPECGTSGLVPGPPEPVWTGGATPPEMFVPGPSIPCPTCQGRVEPNPLRRIGWRQRERGALPKVCARARPDLVIHAGNHGASTSGTALQVPGLVIRHFSWRSPEQYVRKIRNGEQAYRATDLPADVGAHWRAWEGQPDEALVEHFHAWFWTGRPLEDSSLIYDPAPLRA